MTTPLLSSTALLHPVSVSGGDYPVGTVIEALAPPDNSWIRCNGQILAQSDYPDLYAQMDNPHPNLFGNWIVHETITMTGGDPIFESEIVYGAGKYVCTGSQGSIAYSSDLLNWVSSVPFGSIGFYSLAFNGTVFCTLGFNTANSYTSTNGVNWTQNTGVLPSARWQWVVWDGTYFIAACDYTNGYIYRSLDGVSWSKIVDNLPLCGTGSGIDAMETDGAGMVVAASVDKIIAYTLDHGATWTPTAISPYSSFSRINYENGKWLGCLEYQTRGYSDDGINWKFNAGPWFCLSAPYYQVPYRGYSDDDITRWKYLNGIYIGCMNFSGVSVWSTDLKTFNQSIFSPDEDLNLQNAAYDSVNGKYYFYAYSEPFVFEATAFYNMNTHFQLPMAVGDFVFERGRHRYIKVA